MKEPHNYRAVGWSMVVVAGTLAVIGLLTLFLAEDITFSDDIMKENQREFEERKKLEMKEELQGTEFEINLLSKALANSLF